MKYPILLPLAMFLMLACGPRKEVVKATCAEAVTMMSRDFPYESTQFYLDEFTGEALLAIDPGQSKSAAVAKAFPGPSCNYDVVLYGVGENDGASSFSVAVNRELIGDFILPLSKQPSETGDKFNLTVKGVRLRKGDLITVTGRVGTDGKEFSRARWLKLRFVPR